MENEKINKRIAKYIVEAQKASDDGKGINFKTGDKESYPNRERYNDKDKYILNAIHCINACRNTAFRYYVYQIDDGQYIVYFNFKDYNMKRYQVSFHNFSRRLKPFVKNNKCKTEWDHKDSREACYLLEHIYCL